MPLLQQQLAGGRQLPLGTQRCRTQLARAQPSTGINAPPALVQPYVTRTRCVPGTNSARLGLCFTTVNQGVHGRQAAFGTRRAVLASASAEAAVDTQTRFFEWLEANGVTDPAVQLRTYEYEGRPLEQLVARRELAAGEVAMCVPEQLVVTLDRVFQDATLAELLTSNKLSELACLTLYMMYEKKQGQKSFWYRYIKELDRQRGRGQQGAKSPLLWEPGQVEQLLAGSPVVQQIQERLQGIEREYAELDTVWFMAGSLFKNYPYDLPTETFSLQLFKQAFAAVQASVVHLQGVPMSKRFALVPLGPPMVSYSSNSKAMLRYEPSSQCVELKVDHLVAQGEPLTAWCGPQPNSRLLLNYGIVDDANPYDRMALRVMLPADTPLVQRKRQMLAEQQLSTAQAFDLQRGSQALPATLLPYMRLALSGDEEELAGVRFGEGAPPACASLEARVVSQLATALDDRLGRYPTSIEQDEATIASDADIPREKVAARLVRIEKQILRNARSQLQRHADEHGVPIVDDPSFKRVISFV